MGPIFNRKVDKCLRGWYWSLPNTSITFTMLPTFFPSGAKVWNLTYVSQHEVRNPGYSSLPTVQFTGLEHCFLVNLWLWIMWTEILETLYFQNKVETVRFWDSWDPRLGNISRIPKPHGSRRTTLRRVESDGLQIVKSGCLSTHFSWHFSCEERCFATWTSRCVC